MRLIDVDKIDINDEYMLSGKEINDFLNTIPTAYNVDKVVKQIYQILEDYSDADIPSMIDDAVEIVRSGGV